MLKKQYLMIWVLILCSYSFLKAQYELVDAFPNLSFNKPVLLTYSPDETNRIFVVEQGGRILVFPNDPDVMPDQVETFLDITDKFPGGVPPYAEYGLLGLAFHPDYAENGTFFIDYATTQGEIKTHISKYQVSESDPNMANDTTETILLEVNQPFENHNAGMLSFGNDGYLYISLGDGGWEYPSGPPDPDSTAQDLTKLLGSILRIDVDNPSDSLAYGIPQDNPFAGNSQGYREEIFAYGFRNPWRFNIDPVTGKIWVGDVGLSSWEEIDIAESGKNYGWSQTEGFECRPGVDCDTSNYEPPIFVYANGTVGCAITGGAVYRGSGRPELVGKYIYGDWCNGLVWSLEDNGDNTYTNTLLTDEDFRISAFGMDENYELYIIALDFSNPTKIYKFEPVPTYSDNAIPIEAEDADSLGSDFNVVTEGDITYITPLTDFASTTNPGTSDKIAIYQVTFEAPGTYSLYVKLRVGPGTYNDDSFYFANSFGTRPADVDSVWVRVNNIDYGATGLNEYVLTPEENTAGFEVFKWINASTQGEGAPGGTFFEVGADSLTNTFLLGSREDGLDIDKFAFGNADLFYTVSNLENGEPGVTEIPDDLEPTLIVDLSDSIRSVTHAASGALYGVVENIPADIENMVAPLNPRMYVQPARSGAGYQQPYGAAIPVSERLASTTAEVTIRLADINPNWPYQFIGWDNWVNEVTSVINEKIESGRDNYYGYEIWNEQHGTWDEEANGGDFFSTLWEPTYDLIRSLDPDAKIIGPSDSYYSRSRIQEFLEYCIENDCLPDIICWHELGGTNNLSSNIDSYRSLENSLGISPREISINEYSHTTHEYEGAPGPSASFIAKFERKMIHSAAISWWFPGLPGRMGSLLTASNQRGGGWWFYKWYGDMTGYMANVTPPNENSDGIDGFANLDLEQQFASVCFGGDYNGMVNVEVNGIPSSFGDSVDVKVEYVPWENKDTPVSGPETVSLTTYSVSEGAITVPVNVGDPLYGYRVYITPVGKMVDVEPIQVTIPDDFSLSQNYPNPFNPETVIEYSVPINQFVSIRVFDILGREVSELVNEKKQAGKYSVKFDGSNLSSGIYFYSITAGNYHQVKKMVLTK